MLLLYAARVSESEIIRAQAIDLGVSGARAVVLSTLSRDPSFETMEGSGSQYGSLMLPTRSLICVEIQHFRAMGKPRQTQSDKWNHRPAVIAARSQADVLRAAFDIRDRELKFRSAQAIHWVALLKGSGTKKVPAPAGMHRVKPDEDNIDKLIRDALVEGDETIGGLSSTWKLWAEENTLLVAVEGANT